MPKTYALKTFYEEGKIEAGVDEAGRGCLAGPVFAAAVILPDHFDSPTLNDSKKLSSRKRDELREIIEKEALAFSVAACSHKTIDRINILNASIMAMHRAVSRLSLQPEILLIDGNRFTPYENIKHFCIVKGDAKYASIAAASILAKTYRDAFMMRISEKFPLYGWNKNKGYPTRKHREAIVRYGISPHHRKTFKMLDNQLKLNFE